MMEKSAIVVIDVQNALMENFHKPYEATAVIERINILTVQARQVKVPVFFVQHEHAGFLDYGSDGWQLHSDLVRFERDTIIRKSASDPFLNSDLDDRLKAVGVTDLIICGYASEFCVDTAVRRAAGLGYTVQLVADAHTTQDKAHLSAAQIREHHNLTLSLSPTIAAKSHREINFFE